MQWLLRLISNNLAPLTLAGAVAAYLHPPLFLIFKDSFLWFFAATMFALGLVLEPAEVSTTLKQPGRIGLGVLTQYTVMPLLGFTAASLSGLPPEVALGLVIVACAPGAMASNVVVYLAGGAVAYSVALTTVATLLSPLLTPALAKLLGGVFLPVPFWPMMQTILITVLIPLLAGMALRRALGARVQPLVALAPAVAVIAIVIICSYAVAANQERLSVLGPELVLWVILVNALGYVAGWGLAQLYGFERSQQVALTIEIGMQNAGLGVALALKHFAPETALPGALFAVWCIITAAVASRYLRRHGAAAAVAGRRYEDLAD